MDSKMTYGGWLRDARKRHRPPLRQLDIANAIGVDRSYIVKVETGKIDLPQRDTRDRIHAVLGTTEDDLREAGVIRDVTLRGVSVGTGSASGALTVHDATGREKTGQEHSLEAHIRATSAVTADLSAGLTRFVESLNQDQRDLLIDLVTGLIKSDEIPGTPPPVRPTRRASGE